MGSQSLFHELFAHFISFAELFAHRAVNVMAGVVANGGALRKVQPALLVKAIFVREDLLDLEVIHSGVLVFVVETAKDGKGEFLHDGGGGDFQIRQRSRSGFRGDVVSAETAKVRRFLQGGLGGERNRHVGVAVEIRVGLVVVAEANREEVAVHRTCPSRGHRVDGRIFVVGEQNRYGKGIDNWADGEGFVHGCPFFIRCEAR